MKPCLPVPAGSSSASGERASAGRPEAPDAVVATIAAHLRRVVEAVGGRDVGTNGEELWFGTDVVEGLEVRLAADLQRSGYDRSANFSISYGGPSGDPPPSAFRVVIDRIKSIDHAPIAGFTAAFASAAAAAAGHFSDAADDAVSGDGIRGEGMSQSSAPLATEFPQGLPGTDERWESQLTRKLNVVFLDLCAALIGTRGGPLSPLHWGFWPTAPGVAGDDYDPFEAFSENLLAHVPAGVRRIMDVGCGRGANTRRLAAQQKIVTAVSPVAHHCALIAEARLPGVEARCARFEDLPPEPRYDLLLFSESVNHFPLGAEFFTRCEQFLDGPRYVLLADDLTDERIESIESQRVFRIVRSVDISENVAPTGRWWAEQLRVLAAYRTALMSILELHDPAVASRVHGILETLDSSELRLLFSGDGTPPASKGRYMIYLLQRE